MLLSVKSGLLVDIGEFRSSYSKDRLWLEFYSSFKTPISLWASDSRTSFVWGVVKSWITQEPVSDLCYLLSSFVIWNTKSICSPFPLFLEAWCVFKSLFTNMNVSRVWCSQQGPWTGRGCGEGCEHLWKRLRRISLLKAMWNMWEEYRREGWHLD